MAPSARSGPGTGILSGRFAARGRRDAALLAAALLAGLAITPLLTARQRGFLSVQGRKNLQFAANPSLPAALETYPKVRPPLYPMLAWLLARLGGSALRLNELLLGLGLLLLGAYALWAGIASPRSVAPGLLLWALCAFHYENAYQRVAETLYLPLSLALLMALEAYRRSGRPAPLWAAGLLAAACCATRYFGLFVALPVLAAEGLRLGRGAVRERLRALVGPLVLAILPVGLWMAAAWRETGYLTGANRFYERHLPSAVASWHQLRGLHPALLLTGKTLWIDWLSPALHASLGVVTEPHRPTPIELVAGALLLSVAVLYALGWAAPGVAGTRCLAPLGTPALMLAVELGATIAIWTYANNDPIHSRFLYPGYVLVFLLGMHVFERVWEEARPRWLRLLPAAAVLLFAGVQAWRSWTAPVVRFR